MEYNESQLPTLQLLHLMKWEYISPEEAIELRSGKTSNTILEPILLKQLLHLNQIIYKGERHIFNDSNLHKAIQVLKDLPFEQGYQKLSNTIYNRLVNGISLEQTISGDRKSWSLKYIDWHCWQNNVFHYTQEFTVMRSGSIETYRPDIVLFVNGIPLCVIECKSPSIKEPLFAAIAQHLRNQKPDGIRHLYAYSHILLSLCQNDAAYGTLDTPRKFWNHWREKYQTKRSIAAFENLLARKNLTDWSFLGEVAKKEYSVNPTEQDKTMYALCRKDRLLELIFHFTLFDEGVEKIARYQQYFAIKRVMDRISGETSDPRKGGVVWHTQGSGKSLTMVLLATMIALEKSIPNPKIILVADRIDLDDQLCKTFVKCDMRPQRASTGKNLVELLETPTAEVVTTVIHKFEAAAKHLVVPKESNNIFVLVDESHRSQYGSFHALMKKALPNACYIGFTGTPIMKKHKSTAATFGGIIDSYKIDDAVRDKATLPILYEGRHAVQDTGSDAVDKYFDFVTRNLSERQKVDLKKKYSRADQLNEADQKVYAIAMDINLHFTSTWKGTGFKGQLVTPIKATAIKFKKYLDEFGDLTSEVVISPPDMREGDNDAVGDRDDEVVKFWQKMMDRFGTKERYETTIIQQFKKSDTPEIIIVVDKLLTGFDAPQNVVMYLARNLREHTLLQAIARVNRIAEAKDYGYVIDYYGVLGELDKALNTYSGLEGFEEEDLEGTITSINEEIAKLKTRHAALWNIFNGVDSRDFEAMQKHLAPDDVRDKFYERLTDFAKTFKLAVSSHKFLEKENDVVIERYRKDLKDFLNLRKTVSQRFSDQVNFQEYEPQIRELINKHVETKDIITITEQVDIFNKEAFEEEVSKIQTPAARADTIASRTKRAITLNMHLDSAFYKKFSQLLKETIEAYRIRRLTENEYLKRVTEIMHSVTERKDDDLPKELEGEEIAAALYGVALALIKNCFPENKLARKVAAQIGLNANQIFQQNIVSNGKPKVDWHRKDSILDEIRLALDDYFYDEILIKYEISVDQLDIMELVNKCIEIAKVRYN